MPRLGPPRPFGIYVHWPFCVSRCPYCDFNSHVRERVDHAAWRDALVREIGHYAAQTPGRTVQSIFFGGGTPSLMEPGTARTVIDAVRSHWPTSGDLEITLEADPTSVELGKFDAFREAGVNRVSIGIQSLHDDQLRFLGRAHDAAQGLAAIRMAQATFGRYSFDLIYARPGQTLAQWRDELTRALDLARGHLSLYQLTIEPGTAFHTRHARGDFEMPQEDLAADFYEVTQEVMQAAGLPAYEISNHATPGQESRHNLVYWRYGDYAGIGPGAHGRLTLDDGGKIATRAHAAPEIWLRRVNELGHGAHPPERLDHRQRATEAVMMGLRLRDGIDLDALSAEAGQPWQALLDEKKIAALEHEDLLIREISRLRPTLAGMQRLNGILGYLLA